MYHIARMMRGRLSAQHLKKIGGVILLVCMVIYIGSGLLSKRIVILYHDQESPLVQDRNGRELLIRPNVKGQYMRPAALVPPQWSALLLAKEDRFFFYHAGINPVSMIRSMFAFLSSGRFQGSSTLTQQLVKTLLGNENNRSVGNKIIESLYAMSLELYASKQEILSMYSNTAYFGSQAEGIAEASNIYFNVSPESLSATHILELLATLSNPNDYPGTGSNKKKTTVLADQLRVSIDEKTIGAKELMQDEYAYQRKSADMFELGSLWHQCEKRCSLSIDKPLTDTVREILRTNLDSPSFASVDNGAVVVIGLDRDKKENELLAIVGSPHPESSLKGHQINMAVRPRPIGSTAKPFIYAKAFEKGARPYTRVEDTEYRYDIATGFAFYPKNYDGIYRGTVTLHEALSNSLNVPAVKVLQYVGLENFYDFLNNKLHFEPLQPLETYQLSIALGGLEMDLLTLGNYMTVFPNEGVLKPLRVASGHDALTLPMAGYYTEHSVVDRAFTELVTKILSDRETGIDQFGLKSNLNLPATNYAVKTGTSYDYHDSWTIGYTPDFLVGVWLGNSNNKPMYRLSGSVGAGKVWHEVMEVMLNSSHNKKTAFDFTRIKEYTKSKNIEYGLEGDDYDIALHLFASNDLILQPHDNDVLQYTVGIAVPLSSSEEATWYVDNISIGQGTHIIWQPAHPGAYIISAKTQKKTQNVNVIIREPGE